MQRTSKTLTISATAKKHIIRQHYLYLYAKLALFVPLVAVATEANTGDEARRVCMTLVMVGVDSVIAAVTATVALAAIPAVMVTVSVTVSVIVEVMAAVTGSAIVGKLVVVALSVTVGLTMALKKEAGVAEVVGTVVTGFGTVVVVVLVVKVVDTLVLVLLTIWIAGVAVVIKLTDDDAPPETVPLATVNASKAELSAVAVAVLLTEVGIEVEAVEGVIVDAVS